MLFLALRLAGLGFFEGCRALRGEGVFCCYSLLILLVIFFSSMTDCIPSSSRRVNVRYPDMLGVVAQIVPGMPGVCGGMAFCLFDSFPEEGNGRELSHSTM